MTAAQRADPIASLAAIPAGDPAEVSVRQDAFACPDHGADLIRGDAPDRPDPHLVSCLAVRDGVRLRLAAHRRAGPWLPPGGHAEPGEARHDTAPREMREELGVEARVLAPDPVFVTCQRTTGPQPHRGLSLWSRVAGTAQTAYAWVRGEFSDLCRFAPHDIPFAEAEPNLPRYLAKMRRLGQMAPERRIA